jgi:hypothetical protein
MLQRVEPAVIRTQVWLLPKHRLAQGSFPEMKDWKQNDNDMIKTMCYAGVQNFQELRKILYVPGRRCNKVP